MRRAILSILVGLTAFGGAQTACAGQIACWFDHGAIVVPAAFGPIAGDFLLDPATSKSQVNETNAQMVGILTPTVRARLRFAGEHLAGFQMVAADLGLRERPFAAGLAGVIGADALAGFVTEIQTTPCTVTLSRRAGRPWPIQMRLKRIGGALAVRAAVSDGATSRAGWFAVATGGPGVMTADATLTRTPPKDADPGWPPARLRALSVGGLLFENIPAGIADRPAPGLAGSIGEDAWWRFRMRLDPPHRRLDLMPLPGAPKSRQEER